MKELDELLKQLAQDMAVKAFVPKRVIEQILLGNKEVITEWLRKNKIQISQILNQL